MSEDKTCPHCGSRLPARLLVGLCAKCVVRFSLLASDGAPDLPAGDAGSLRRGLRETSARIFGDYELLDEIACGGMGVVYRARQISLNRLVAVKMLLHGGFAREEVVQRFRAEARAAASLQHPGIVAIHEVGTHQGLPYFSMDYVEGSSLDALCRDGPLPADRAARYVRLIAEAIHHAHERGILHRDLKPSNVLIDASDQPRVTDFGLAKRLATDSDLTITGQVLGSVGYMSPEQAAGKRDQVGVASDVYSLGAILYHLLTGQPPFAEETIHQTLLRLQTEDPSPPQRLNSDVPPGLESICLKCLRKEPGGRYESACALADDLHRWQAGEPLLAQPEPALARVGQWCRQRPWRTAAAGAVFLALLGGVLWLAISRQRDVRARAPEALVPTSTTADFPAVTWVQGADLLEANQEVRAAMLDGRVYVVGGRSGHGEPHRCVRTVQIYDSETDRWSLGPPLPEPLAAVGLIAHRGNLYCFGGITNAVWWGTPVASAYCLNPRTGQWRKFASMPVPRSNFAVASLGDRIYCAGGNRIWPDATSRVDAYDPATDAWQFVPNLPSPRGSTIGGNWRGKLVVAFGLLSAHSGSCHTLFVYDDAARRWAAPVEVPKAYPSEYGCMHSDDEAVYFVGSREPAKWEYWLSRVRPESGGIEFLVKLPALPSGWSAVAYDPARATAYLIGGSDTTNSPPLRLLKAQVPLGPAAR